MARKAKKRSRKATVSKATLHDLVRMYTVHYDQTSVRVRKAKVVAPETIDHWQDTDVFPKETMNSAARTVDPVRVFKVNGSKYKAFARKAFNTGGRSIVNAADPFGTSGTTTNAPERKKVLVARPVVPRASKNGPWRMIPVLGVLIGFLMAVFSAVRAEVDRSRLPLWAQDLEFDELFEEVTEEYDLPHEFDFEDGDPFWEDRYPGGRHHYYGFDNIDEERWPQPPCILLADVVHDAPSLPQFVVQAHNWVVPRTQGHARAQKRPALFARPPPYRLSC